MQGTPVSDGVACGRLYYLHNETVTVPEFTIKEEDIDREIARFQSALQASKQDLQILQTSLQKRGYDEVVSIIGTHIQLLEDPLISDSVACEIRATRKNTESVFREITERYEKRLSSLADEYFEERQLDLRDLSKRVLNHLDATAERETLKLPKNTILYAEEIVPTDTAEGLGQNVLGFLSHQGGATSHAALIARAKGLPFVSGVQLTSAMLGCDVIVDGTRGIVIINPESETYKKYEAFSKPKGEADALGPVTTKDGTPISVCVNVDSLHTVNAPILSDGVGLFRSEFIGHIAPNLAVETQVEIYKKVFTAFSGKPIVFRAFDFGSDKCPDSLDQIGEEQNPALGLRSLRYLIYNEQLFRNQLRALLTAAQGRAFQFLLPLVTDIDEFLHAKGIVDEEIHTFEGVPPQSVQLGAMIETPSAVWEVEALLDVVDFLSIGTNDLMQYSLAVDRTNRYVSKMYGDLHPSVFKAIAHIVQAAKKRDAKVSLCGNIASRSEYIPLLIGVGLRSISCSEKSVKMVKEKVMEVDREEAEQVAKAALSTTSLKAFTQLL